MQDWISIKTSLPKNGQRIKGRNKEGAEWQEVWDEDEPIGNMVEWKPLD